MSGQHGLVAGSPGSSYLDAELVYTDCSKRLCTVARPIYVCEWRRPEVNVKPVPMNTYPT